MNFSLRPDVWVAMHPVVARIIRSFAEFMMGIGRGAPENKFFHQDIIRRLGHGSRLSGLQNACHVNRVHTIIELRSLG